jgi:hypothetical protein
MDNVSSLRAVINLVYSGEDWAIHDDRRFSLQCADFPLVHWKLKPSCTRVNGIGRSSPRGGIIIR